MPYGSKTLSNTSGRFPVVVMQHSAEPLGSEARPEAVQLMTAIKRRILRLEGAIARRIPREIRLSPELHERAGRIAARILANPEQWPEEIAIIESLTSGETNSG